MTSDKAALKFVNALLQLNPVEFLGVSKILCVPVVDSEKEPRQFDEILSDLIDNFIKLNRRNRRELLSILKESAKVTDDEFESIYKQWSAAEHESE